MPHQCTNCDRTFPDGSKEMLSGCPDCGGNKFRFRPEGGQLGDAGDLDSSPHDTPPDPPEPDDGVTGSVGRAAAAVRNRLAGSDAPGDREDAADTGSGDPPDFGSSDVTDLGPVDDGARVEGASAPDGDGPDTPTPDPADPTGSPDPADPTGSGSPGPGGSNSPGPGGSNSPGSGVSGSPDSGESGTDGDPDPWFETDSDTPIEAEMGDEEDDAQASARTSVVDPSDLPGGTAPDASGTSGDAPTARDPSEGAGTDPRSGGSERTPRTDTGPGSGGSGGEVAGNPGADVAGTPGEKEAGTPGRKGGGAPGADPKEGGNEEPDLAALREELNEQFESIKIVEPGQYELNLMELYDRDEYIISLMEDGRYAIEVPERWRDGD